MRRPQFRKVPVSPPHVLNPGDVGSFSAMPEADARYARVKIVFKDSRQSLSWVDQSGMNAHE
jgi:hypothetical protein